MAYEIKRFPYPGTIDADGHVLEPGDLSETYLEARYKPQALRIRTDDDGFEYLEIDQRPSKRTVRGSLGILEAGADCFMWATDYPHPDHPHTWVDDLTAYARKLAPDVRAKVLGDNVRRIYRIDYRRAPAQPAPATRTRRKAKAKQR